ncbi:MAG: UTP--glucose-1-phosphate uridylyltransferase [Clostridia bacterium]|nr:UTP--glucose-1-phosphate uridylyltransferase [Clostridia bacterium]
MDLYNRIYEKLEKAGQLHLLSTYDGLGDEAKASLLQQLDAVDFDLMGKLYEKASAASTTEVTPAFNEIEPLPYLDTTKMTDAEKVALSRVGLASIGKGELAVLTMAGGQGTRLGHDGPKGTYSIQLPGDESLFEIQCKGIDAVAKRAGYQPHWYIMTSTINHGDTVAFFEAKNYFGYPKEKIHFFPQTMIPAVTEDGKLQLASESELLRSPNGNGGMFISLANCGLLDVMKAHGAKYLFVCGIDNCLVKMADPMFLGALLTDEKQPQATAKSYIKRDPGEKAGIFCRRDGRPGVLEYTEIPTLYAEMKNDNGEWTYGDTNVLNYIFTLDAVERLAALGTEYHIAVKKLTYLDPETKQEITVPKGYKFELFLFDTFLYLDDLQVVRIERTEEFAPVKNPTGIDSAESAREMYLEFERTNPRKWEEQI